jgi:hypothetical protein
MKLTEYQKFKEEYECIHDEKLWVIKVDGQYFYQPNQGSLVCGEYLHSAHKYKSSKKALKEFTKILNYVDGGHRVVYDVIEVCHRNVYYTVN